jgi:hypothetical protein
MKTGTGRAEQREEPRMTVSRDEQAVEPDGERYVTLDVDVSGDLEARWVYDCEEKTVGLLLRHVA